MSARLQRASKQTLTSRSFSGYSLTMLTSLGITPFWTNWSCWYAVREVRQKVMKDKVTKTNTEFYYYSFKFILKSITLHSLQKKAGSAS